MKNKTTQNSVVFLSVVAGVLLLAYGAAGFYIYNMQQGTSDLFDKITSQKQSEDQQTSLAILAKNTKADLATLSGAIVPKDGAVAFIKNLETLGTTERVDFKISSAEETSGGTFQNLNFEVTVGGSWAQVLKTLDIIESMPYKVSMRSVALTSGDSSPVSSGKGAGVPHRWQAAVSFSVLKDK